MRKNWKSCTLRTGDARDAFGKIQARHHRQPVRRDGEAALEWGIRGRFSIVLASAELGLSKPDSRIFAAAISRAGCAPEGVLMVGDRLDNDIGTCQIVRLLDNACFAGFLTVSDAAARRRDSRLHDFDYQETPGHPVCDAAAARALRPGPALRVGMKIIGATCFSLRIPFVEAFGHSASVRSRSDSVVVRLTAEDGTVGYGEGLPRPYVTGETSRPASIASRIVSGPPLRTQTLGRWNPARTPFALWTRLAGRCPTAIPTVSSRGTPHEQPAKWLCSTSVALPGTVSGRGF